MLFYYCLRSNNIVTVDSLHTYYMASGPRSHNGMCPGLAEQYYLMPDTETSIGCPCTILLPVPTFHIVSECVYVPHQAQVICRDEHISSHAAIFVLIGLGPRLVFIHFVMEKRFIPRKAGLVYFCVPFMILTPVCQIISYLSSSEFRNTVLRANEKKAFSSEQTSSPIVPPRAQHGSPGRYNLMLRLILRNATFNFCPSSPNSYSSPSYHRPPPTTVYRPPPPANRQSSGRARPTSRLHLHLSPSTTTMSRHRPTPTTDQAPTVSELHRSPGVPRNRRTSRGIVRLCLASWSQYFIMCTHVFRDTASRVRPRWSLSVCLRHVLVW